MCSFLFDNYSVRIRFCNFYYGFNPKTLSFISKEIERIAPKLKIVKYYKPQIEIFSVFGNAKKLRNSKTAIKIFYTGENVNGGSYNRMPFTQYKGNMIDISDLSIGFDYMAADNYIRFPLWLVYFFSRCNSKDEIKRALDSFKTLHIKTKFCSLISRHDMSGIRTRIYSDVCQISKVDCPGKLLYNDASLLNKYNDNKKLYLQQYKFNICPENSISKGYVTEKIFESIASGCIPIYNGWSKDPEPGIINPNIILWYDDLDAKSNKEMFKELKKLNESDKLYRSFAEQPFFCDTAIDKIYCNLANFKEKMQIVAFKINKKQGCGK